MPNFPRIAILLSYAALALVARAQTPVFQLDPWIDSSVYYTDYLLLPGSSSTLPGRVDAVQLGGTARTLAQVDVHLVMFGLEGDETADIQVKIYSGFDTDSGTFVGEVWSSDILDNQAIGINYTLYSFFPSTSDIILPDTLYYGVVFSDIQGNPDLLGTALSDPNATPTSEFGPAPALPSSSFWYLNADNTTYSVSNPASASAVTIYATEAIPEPGTLGVLGVGTLLLGLLHRLRVARA